MPADSINQRGRVRVTSNRDALRLSLKSVKCDQRRVVFEILGYQNETPQGPKKAGRRQVAVFKVELEGPPPMDDPQDIADAYTKARTQVRKYLHTSVDEADSARSLTLRPTKTSERSR